MSPRPARLIRSLLHLPLPRVMKPDERKAYRQAKSAYARLSSVGKTLYNANAKAVLATSLS